MADIYEELYTPGPCQKVPCGMTFGLNQLSEEDTASLREPITVDELEAAVNSLNLAKAPGIDGIPVECYLKFWTWFAPILAVWTQQTILLGKLCGSAAMGIITLIHKGGDHRNIKNWRPITLMTVDAKILSRALAIRLKSTILKIIPDFQNCLPGRSIHRSLAIVRDIIACTKIKQQPICILSLDQTKAFDRINHDFLFRLMEIICIPSYILQAIKAIYSDYTVMLKNVDSLSRPVKYRRGIRQGDPLSTILYALAFLPALNMVQMALPNEGYLLSNGSRVMLTSYADDATFFLRSLSSIQVVVNALSMIATFSEAKINLLKSVAAPFFYSTAEVDNFKREEQEIIVTPNRIHILGIWFTPQLGIDQNQWDSKLQSSRDKILQQNTMLCKLTYFDRARWISSRIWPRWVYLLKIMQPTAEQIHQLQVVIAEAVWLGGKHWIRYEDLAVPRKNGGISLISPVDRIRIMRIMFICKTILEGTSSHIFLLAETVLNSYAEAGLGFGVLHTIPEQHQVTKLPPFYRSLLLAWDAFPMACPISSVNQLMALPSFSSRFLSHLPHPVNITSTQARAFGVTILRHFYTSQHRTTRQFVDAKTATLDVVQDWCKSVLGLEEVDISNNNVDGDLERIRAPHFVLQLEEKTYPMDSWNHKLLITTAQANKGLTEDRGVPPQTWKTLIREDISPTAKNQYFRFLHLKVPTPSFYVHMGVRTEYACILCRSPEADYTHQFCKCPGLSLALNALTQDIQSLGLDLLPDQRMLYVDRSYSASLANICIITFIYMVILITRSIANTGSHLTTSKVKDIYYDLLGKHIIVYARQHPPSILDKRFKWLVLTHGELIAKFTGNLLYIRTSSGFHSYDESKLTISQ